MSAQAWNAVAEASEHLPHPEESSLASRLPGMGWGSRAGLRVPSPAPALLPPALLGRAQGHTARAEDPETIQGNGKGTLKTGQNHPAMSSKMPFPFPKPADLDSVKSDSSSCNRAVQGTITGKLTLTWIILTKGNSAMPLHYKPTFSIYLDS